MIINKETLPNLARVKSLLRMKADLGKNGKVLSSQLPPPSSNMRGVAVFVSATESVDKEVNDIWIKI